MSEPSVAPETNRRSQGTYNVNADVVNADGTPITCLQATVKFGGDKKSIVGDIMGDL